MDIHSISSKVFLWLFHTCLFVLPYYLVKFHVQAKKEKPKGALNNLLFYLESIGGAMFSMGFLSIMFLGGSDDGDAEDRLYNWTWNNFIATMIVATIAAIVATHRNKKLIKEQDGNSLDV